MHGFLSSPLPHALVKPFLLQTLLCMNLRPVPSSLEHVWFHCSVNSRNISHGKHLLELRGTESRGGSGERVILCHSGPLNIRVQSICLWFIIPCNIKFSPHTGVRPLILLGTGTLWLKGRTWPTKLLLDCGIQAKDHQKDSAPGSKNPHQKRARRLLLQGGCRRILQGKLWLSSRPNQPLTAERRGKEREKKASRHIAVALSITQMLLQSVQRRGRGKGTLCCLHLKCSQHNLC